jgi:hypothetical protein
VGTRWKALQTARPDHSAHSRVPHGCLGIKTRLLTWRRPLKGSCRSLFFLAAEQRRPKEKGPSRMELR